MGFAQPSGLASDDNTVLVCINCARVVVFEQDGWTHRDEGSTCASLEVAWPPPSDDEDPEEFPESGFSDGADSDAA